MSIQSDYFYLLHKLLFYFYAYSTGDIYMLYLSFNKLKLKLFNIFL